MLYPFNGSIPLNTTYIYSFGIDIFYEASAIRSLEVSAPWPLTSFATRDIVCPFPTLQAGMTTFFTATGDAVPCTVIALEDGNIVTQVKTPETDGYSAIQIGYQPMKEKNIKKPEMGHLKKVGAGPLRHLTEFRVRVSRQQRAHVLPFPAPDA